MTCDFINLVFAIIMFLCIFVQQITIQLMYKMIKESVKNETT